MQYDQLLDILVKSTVNLDVYAKKELDLAKAKPESAPSLKPPKEWWDNAVKSLKAKNPKLSEESVKKIIGDLWANRMKRSSKKEARKAEGKKYGKAPVAKSFDTAMQGLGNLVKGLGSAVLKKAQQIKGQSDPEPKQAPQKEQSEIAKSFDTAMSGMEDMIKAGKGEGARGGRVIGHTKSGKAIYASSSLKELKQHHKKFTPQDHKEAGEFHRKVREGEKDKSSKKATYHHQMAMVHESHHEITKTKKPEAIGAHQNIIRDYGKNIEGAYKKYEKSKAAPGKNEPAKKDLTTLSKQQHKESITALSKLSLKELRKRQDLTTKQIQIAGKEKKTEALKNLRVMEQHLTQAVMKREFGKSIQEDEMDTLSERAPGVALIKAIIDESKAEIAQVKENVVTDETGKKLKPTDIRPAKVLRRFEDLLRYYEEELKRNFDISKITIKAWMENSYYYMGNCTAAEKEKIISMLEKSKPKCIASVAQDIIWSLRRAVRQGALDNNDPKMNQFKKQLEAVINKYNKKKGVKKSYEGFDTAMENLVKSITGEGKPIEKGKASCPKKDKDEKKDEEDETQKGIPISISDLHKALEATYPVGRVYNVPGKGSGVIQKSEGGKISVDVMGTIHDIDFSKGLPVEDGNAFTELHKSACLQTGEPLEKSLNNSSVVTKEAGEAWDKTHSALER